jgi:hypothetical protein
MNEIPFYLHVALAAVPLLILLGGGLILDGPVANFQH